METWEKVQEKMHEQKVKYRKYYDPDRKELSHWLVGIVRCEKCGAVLSNQGGFYGCSNRSRGTCKGVGYIKTSKLDGIVLNALSDVALPNVKLAFAEPETIERVETEDESLIISTQIQRLEIRLDRVKLAYEDGVDTLQEYKRVKPMHSVYEKRKPFKSQILSLVVCQFVQEYHSHIFVRDFSAGDVDYRQQYAYKHGRLYIRRHSDFDMPFYL
ncbi:MAG: hypothetical protein E7390_04760 [Ruminococcaceae bacterium]|nr:hypothetical protein [Oscillospiraceae bacterium]